MIPIWSGDVYCPRCRSARVGVDFTRSNHFWHCEDCKYDWRWDHDGTDWIWPEGTKPTPGCPYCGTQNIVGHALPLDLANWHCLRELCDQWWVGKYDGGTMRWHIRVPARDVPFRRTLDNPTTYPHQQETP